MQHFPRQTSGSTSTSSTTPPGVGPSSNSVTANTSISVAQNSTSVSVSNTSVPPSTTLTSLPPSVTISPPPTSVPPSSTISDPPTSPSLSISTPPNSSVSDTSSLSESSSQSLSFSSTLPLENITTIVTSINGQITTFTSQLPTSLVNATPNNPGSSSRTAVIAGTTAGVIILLCLALSSIFAYRRHRLRQVLALTNQKKEGKGLLDGEEFDDDDVGVPMRWHADQQYSSRSTTGRAGSPAPSLIRSRVSETGSIFREEVWPPPGFVDPIKQGSNEVNLANIVDDVMGPNHNRSVSRLGERDPFASTTDVSHHSHLRDTTDTSATSTSGLLPQPSQLLPSSNDPFNPNSDAPSAYYPSVLPPGASPPSIPGQIFYPPSPARSSRAETIPKITETPPTPGPGPSSFDQQQQQHQRNTSNGAQPKKSSPLVRPLSGDASLWLSRSPHPS